MLLHVIILSILSAPLVVLVTLLALGMRDEFRFRRLYGHWFPGYKDTDE